jgi:hypothetical protein
VQEGRVFGFLYEFVNRRERLPSASCMNFNGQDGDREGCSDVLIKRILPASQLSHILKLGLP